MEAFIRIERLVGAAAMERLAASRVAVFGVGGVGGHAAEALARSGVGALDLFDNDQVAVSNLNRQIIALHSTLGRPKAEAMAQRILDINPGAKVVPHALFYLPERADQVDFAAFDYIVDAIDTVAAKLDLIQQAYRRGIPIISAMGAGNRLDPGRLRVGDLFETQNCPLARVMRRELRRRGVPALRVVYSTEPALRPAPPDNGPGPSGAPRRDTPGSTAFVPSVMGLMMASVVVRQLMGLPV